MRAPDVYRLITRVHSLFAFVIPLCAVLAVNPAFAHAMLEHASPGAGAIISVPPKTLVLDYSEPLQPGFSSVEIRDDSGRNVAGPVTIENAEITVALKPLPPGHYHVVWRAVSVDAHHTHGAYTFTVTP